MTLVFNMIWMFILNLILWLQFQRSLQFDSIVLIFSVYYHFSSYLSFKLWCYKWPRFPVWVLHFICFPSLISYWIEMNFNKHFDLKLIDIFYHCYCCMNLKYHLNLLGLKYLLVLNFVHFTIFLIINQFFIYIMAVYWFFFLRKFKNFLHLRASSFLQ